ncbi:glycosyltransferase family 4 protein [Pantanalinema sp. GBBB05]|uniref:glycosyltransferase family 4 protein n=1 Tax=Pantanalinema sp. GBBB05 TaxID=2604139 RepID=UPI001DC0A42E|nr:glycosyltransferase family 4 protein [Pantanalinema sp. GBBB05]
MSRKLTSSPIAQSPSEKLYRFGFLLSTGMGNATRYQNLRKYAEKDLEVECVWAPVKHFIAPDEPNPFWYLPEPFYSRAVVVYQSSPVLRQLGKLDAVMFHLFEAYTLACVRSVFSSRPLIVNAHDDPPVVNPETYPLYENRLVRSSWRRRFRLGVDLWCAKRTELFLPFSEWGRKIWVNECHVPPDKVYPIHVGIDLDIWRYTPKPEIDPAARRKILFVGGDFVRKGGDLLLDIYRQQFADQAELHLVTRQPPADLPPNVYVYTDLTPNDQRLFELYSQADLFVFPTRADLSPFAPMEAMASGCPVISTNIAGVPDTIQHGETGFVIARDDASALATYMQTLLENPQLRRTMGVKGRAVVERDFNAAINVPRILAAMKKTVDQHRRTT